MLILLSQNEQGIIKCIRSAETHFSLGDSPTFPWMLRHDINYYKGEQIVWNKTIWNSLNTPERRKPPTCASHWQTLSQPLYTSPWSRFELTISVVIGIEYIVNIVIDNQTLPNIDRLMFGSLTFSWQIWWLSCSNIFMTNFWCWTTNRLESVSVFLQLHLQDQNLIESSCTYALGLKILPPFLWIAIIYWSGSNGVFLYIFHFIHQIMNVRRLITYLFYSIYYVEIQLHIVSKI